MFRSSPKCNQKHRGSVKDERISQMRQPQPGEAAKAVQPNKRLARPGHTVRLSTPASSKKHMNCKISIYFVARTFYKKKGNVPQCRE